MHTVATVFWSSVTRLLVYTRFKTRASLRGVCIRKYWRRRWYTSLKYKNHMLRSACILDYTNWDFKWTNHTTETMQKFKKVGHM